ncbi:hypothetical protein BLOT_008887 [Blomia tropicalis]|nr:hypothetical protein BLOT_008887 [Blomia tropicalis]
MEGYKRRQPGPSSALPMVKRKENDCVARFFLGKQVDHNYHMASAETILDLFSDGTRHAPPSPTTTRITS